MSLNRKEADGTYTEVAGIPFVTKENIGLGKVENKSPEELVEMSMEAGGYVTPEQFGAVGDGETDDTTAVENALSANKTVIFCGKYNITRTLVISAGHHLIGHGGNLINVNCDVLFNIVSLHTDKAIIEGININANHHKVIKTNSEDSWGRSYHLRNVHVYDTTNDAIVNTDCFNVYYNNVTIAADSTSSGSLINLGATGKTFSNVVNMENCCFIANTNMDVVTTGTAYNAVFTNCTFEFFRYAFIATSRITAISCWFEKGYAISTTDRIDTFNPHTAAMDNLILQNNKQLMVALPQFSRYWYDVAAGESMLEKAFADKLLVQRIYMNGNQGNVYKEKSIEEIYTDRKICNVPVNTRYYTGTQEETGFGNGEIDSAAKGVVRFELEYIKIGESATRKARIVWLLVDNQYIELSRESSGAEDSLWNFQYIKSQEYYRLADRLDGTYHAVLRYERLAY